jgi:group I intron endonuclease
MIIYKTTNIINQKYYIGKDSKNNPNYLGSGISLNRAIKKYGRENFLKEIIEHCKSLDHLNERERFWINELNAVQDPMSYNVHEGGNGGNTGAYHKVGRHGVENSMFGKVTSEETKKLISKKTKEWHLNESEEHKIARIEKSRIKQKGRPKNPISVKKNQQAKIIFFKNNKVTRAVYRLISSKGEVFEFNGTKDLFLWAKTNNHSIWTISRRLLNGIPPKSGSLVGWSATVNYQYQKFPSAT